MPGRDVRRASLFVAVLPATDGLALLGRQHQNGEMIQRALVLSCIALVGCSPNHASGFDVVPNRPEAGGCDAGLSSNAAVAERTRVTEYARVPPSCAVIDASTEPADGSAIGDASDPCSCEALCATTRVEPDPEFTDSVYESCRIEFVEGARSATCVFSVMPVSRVDSPCP